MMTITGSVELVEQLMTMVQERFNAVREPSKLSVDHPLVGCDRADFQTMSTFSVDVTRRFADGRQAHLSFGWHTGELIPGQEQWLISVETADGDHREEFLAARQSADIAASAQGREELNDEDAEALSASYLSIPTGGTFKPVLLPSEVSQEEAIGLFVSFLLFGCGS